MKKQLILACGLMMVMGLVFAGTANAQWNSGTGIQWTNNDVGIGLNNPSGSFHILRTSPGQFAIQERVENHVGGSALVMRKARGTTASRLMPINDDVIGGLFGQVWANGDWRPAATIRFFADGDVTSATANSKIQFQVQDGGTAPSTMINAMTIRHTGAVGIGTEVIPTGFLLAVNGKVIAEELQVQLNSNWPDFVFDSDYDLLSLNELEDFVSANRHLPGVPNEKIIKEQGGVNVGEMTSILLQKVEELTLHIIELNKRIDELEK